MPLEVATLPNQLVVTNPLHTDGLNTMDSHLRLLKTVLADTFPNLNAALTCSDADLNSTTGLATQVGNLLANALNLALTTPQTMAGTLQVPVLNALQVQQQGVPLIPGGVVVMWAGLHTAVPAGWLLCNGQNGTPNLLDRFVVGAGNQYADFQTGGNLGISISTSAAGNHNHGGADQPAGGISGTFGTDAEGTHSHGGSTSAHTLALSEIPSHAHDLVVGLGSGGQGAIPTGLFSGTTLVGSQMDSQGGGQGHGHGIASDGLHGHNVTINTGAHVHGITADGTHSHTVAFDNRAPYYALAFIIKQ